MRDRLRGTLHLAVLVLGLATCLVLPATRAEAQSCWSCQHVSGGGADIDCVAGEHGRECVITCTNNSCRRRASLSCGTAGLVGGCEPPSGTVLAGDISVSEGRVTVRPSVGDRKSTRLNSSHQ